MSDKPVRENIRQHQALLAYSSMPDPSLQILHQEWAEYVPKFKKPAFRTLKSWSAKYQWVERSKAIHWEVKEKAVRRTIDQLTMSKDYVSICDASRFYCCIVSTLILSSQTYSLILGA